MMNETTMRAVARESGRLALKTQDLLAAVGQVNAYAARTAARATARRRMRELRDLARRAGTRASRRAARDLAQCRTAALGRV